MFISTNICKKITFNISRYCVKIRVYWGLFKRIYITNSGLNGFVRDSIEGEVESDRVILYDHYFECMFLVIMIVMTNYNFILYLIQRFILIYEIVNISYKYYVYVNIVHKTGRIQSQNIYCMWFSIGIYIKHILQYISKTPYYQTHSVL